MSPQSPAGCSLVISLLVVYRLSPFHPLARYHIQLHLYSSASLCSTPRPEVFLPTPRRILETLDSQELVLVRRALIPFSMGPENCTGKSLAMLELRAVVSLFIMHFDDDFDPKAWLESLKDYFFLGEQEADGEIESKTEKGSRMRSLRNHQFYTVVVLNCKIP